MEKIKNIFWKTLYASLAVLVLTLCIVLSLEISASKGSFSWSYMTSIFNKTTKTEVTNLETKGNNARAYFSDNQDPNTGKWYRCRDIFSTNTGVGSTCWETTKPNK